MQLKPRGLTQTTSANRSSGEKIISIYSCETWDDSVKNLSIFTYNLSTYNLSSPTQFVLDPLNNFSIDSLEISKLL